MTQLDRLPHWPCSTGFTWALGGAALALLTATATLAISDGDGFILAFIPGAVVSAVLGGLIAVRRPGHPIGSLLCASALASATSDWVFCYARAAVFHYPGTLPFGTLAMWFAAWDYVPAATLGSLVFPLVFPDGRLLSRRWRPALWGAVGYLVLAAAGNAFTQLSMGGWFGDRPNPYAVGGPVPVPLSHKSPRVLDVTKIRLQSLRCWGLWLSSSRGGARPRGPLRPRGHGPFRRGGLLSGCAG